MKGKKIKNVQVFKMWLCWVLLKHPHKVFVAGKKYVAWMLIINAKPHEDIAKKIIFLL